MTKREAEDDGTGNQPLTLVLDIKATSAALSVGRTVVFDLLARGELTRVKIGRRTGVTLQSIKALVARASATNAR